MDRSGYKQNEKGNGYKQNEVNGGYQYNPCVQPCYPCQPQNQKQRIVLPLPQIEDIPLESTVQYIPYQKTQVKYEQVQRTQKVPRQVWTTQYQTINKRQRRPVQKIIQDYYKVQKIIDYIPQYIPQKKIEYVPIQVISHQVQFIPYQRVIVHYPKEAVNFLDQNRVLMNNNNNVTQVYDFMGPFKSTLIIQNLFNQNGVTAPSLDIHVTTQTILPTNLQRWRLIKYGNAYELENYENGKVLDCSSVKEGNELIVSESRHQASQQWFLDLQKGEQGYLRSGQQFNLCVSVCEWNRRLMLSNIIKLNSKQLFNFHGLSSI